MDPDRFLHGVCLSQLSPNLAFWSGVGWSAHLGPEVVSGLLSQGETSFSINTRELLAVERGLLHFRSSVSHPTVMVFADDSTAVAYLRNAGGTRSPALNSIAQRILRWSELHHVRLAPVHHGKSQCSGRLSLSRSRSKGQSGLSIWKSFWSSAANGRSWSTCLLPQQITAAPSISRPAEILRRWGRTLSYSPGDTSRPTRSHHGL